jgi:hypothetical protein
LYLKLKVRSGFFIFLITFAHFKWNRRIMEKKRELTKHAKYVEKIGKKEILVEV